MSGPTLSVPVSLTPRRATTAPALTGISEAGPDRLALQAGEHYRFRFDMTACIGCHSCEVACAEQNGLPAEVSWRRVGEIEGGEYPNTQRFHMSMACNHCLEPACLQGCPTSAYEKLSNGIVIHHADDCIGCQYCTWNCPYSVPAFQPDRRIVTKCDMCSRRLEVGLESACVAACPTSAITIERIDPVEWRANPIGADAPHLPSSLITRSTTQIILPVDVPAETLTGSSHRLHLEHPHWSLLMVTLLTQLALGLAAGGLAAALADERTTGVAVIAALSGAVALAASPLHLGRPAVAYKAMRNLRSSWLSREVLGFSLFGALAFVTAAFGVLDIPGRIVTAIITVAVGAAAVFASGRLYKVPGRPAWDSWTTPLSFELSAVALGAPVSVALLTPHDSMLRDSMIVAGAAAAISQAFIVVRNLLVWRRSQRHEARATVILTLHHCRIPFAARVLMIVIASVAAVVALNGSAAAVIVMAAAIVISEILGRWLFYVTVVPLAMPGRFSGGWR